MSLKEGRVPLLEPKTKGLTASQARVSAFVLITIQAALHDPSAKERGGGAALKHSGRHAIDMLLKSSLSNTRFGVYRDEVDDTLLGDSTLVRLPVDKSIHQYHDRTIYNFATQARYATLIPEKIVLIQHTNKRCDSRASK